MNPWEWDEPTWRGHVERVRAGQKLTPSRWPGGARVAVAISFDADHETISLRNGETSPGLLARGEYGSRVATPRILRLLREHGVPASFFVPAVSALLHPADIESFVDGGHEVAVHGWIHERNTLLSPAEELDLTGRACDTLERLAGTRPVGIRTPSWDFSDATLDVIRRLGLRYDSSLMADDEPYELLAGGEPTGIVELPVEWIRDDWPYLTRSTPPRAMLEVWRDEFDAAYAEGGFFQLTMHPHVIGHRSRLVVLAELLAHIARHSGVWFGTHAQVMEAVWHD
ncbi:polysaccharide deacetylase family protein [Amycolatopsis lurida]